MSRSLVALGLLAFIVSLLPCPSMAAVAEDDCCPPSGASVSALCCGSEGQTAPATRPAPAQLAASLTATHAGGMPLEPAAFTAARPQPLISRPVVARTILRI